MSNPHKILLYSDTPLFGGAERQMLTLAKHLDRNHYIPVFAVRQSPDLEKWHEEIRKSGIELHIIKSRGKNSLSNLRALLKIIKKTRPALIHAHIWNPMACKYVFPAAWLKNIPLVLTEHDPFQVKGLRKIYKNLTLGQTARIITVSNANRELMQKLYPKQSPKIITVHNGIEKLRGTIDDIQKLRIKKSVFGAGPETKIIFAAGALHPRKGFKYLITAFHSILGKIDNTKLVIAGLGPNKEELVRLIANLKLEKRVVMLGFRDDIMDLMQASDIFVLPSLKEAFGLVIIEAMQCGVPVIATNAGGVPEIITSEKEGLLVKPAGRQSLAKALYKLLTHPEQRKAMMETGLQHWKDFSADKMARETEVVYNQAINKNS